MNIAVEQKRRLSQIEMTKMGLKKVETDSEEDRVRNLNYVTSKPGCFFLVKNLEIITFIAWHPERNLKFLKIKCHIVLNNFKKTLFELVCHLRNSNDALTLLIIQMFHSSCQNPYKCCYYYCFA